MSPFAALCLNAFFVWLAFPIVEYRRELAGPASSLLPRVWVRNPVPPLPRARPRTAWSTLNAPARRLRVRDRLSVDAEWRSRKHSHLPQWVEQRFPKRPRLCDGTNAIVVNARALYPADAR
jgi:hypothetical protein